MTDFQLMTDSKQGNYVVTSSFAFEDILEQRNLSINGLDVKVGEMTDLYGWFSEPLRFCGFLDKNFAIFYLGQGNSDLFETGAHYYDATMIIASDRIGKSYKAGTFRDVHLRDRNNIKYWK